jgi:hypothetical protein
MLVGTVGAKRSEAAWQQVYRALNHADAKQRCNSQIILRFPQAIQDFASMFVAMQIKRHDADYNPSTKALKSEVIADIEAVQSVIEGFAATDQKDRRAFAIWVLVRDRKP